MLYIFDLDHTLIDSSHRQLTRPDGTLDLAHWRENCTREKILADSLLPLGYQVADYLSKSNRNITIACTARVMGEPDYAFLRQSRLHFDSILSRPDKVTLGDVILKDFLLRAFARNKQMPFARMAAISHFWDDNENIRKHFTVTGFTCYNPASFNKNQRKLA